jgi:hypothetical protein
MVWRADERGWRRPSPDREDAVPRRGVRTRCASRLPAEQNGRSFAIPINCSGLWLQCPIVDAVAAGFLAAPKAIAGISPYSLADGK